MDKDFPKAHLKYLLGLSLVDGIGPAKFQALIEYFGDPLQAWQADRDALVRLGLDKRTLNNFLEARQTLDLERKMAEIESAGVTLLPFRSADYPSQLAEIPNPPMLLQMAGEITAADINMIAVVGTRRVTSYGRQMTREIVTGLVRRGITIVSGLARGIDTIAHTTALELGGRTIAVLGSGLGQIYPPENRNLAHDIVKSGQGALLSEYPLDKKPQAKNFPPRNRIISGLTFGSCVVEGQIKSGALITAKFAADQGREVFAVPGNVTSPASEGPNALIQQGAKLVTCVEDILEEINPERVRAQVAVQMALPESAEEAAMLPHLSRSPQHVDDICRLSGLPASIVGSTLTLLELKGVVTHVGGMKYALLG